MVENFRHTYRRNQYKVRVYHPSSFMAHTKHLEDMVELFVDRYGTDCRLIRGNFGPCELQIRKL